MTTVDPVLTLLLAPAVGSFLRLAADRARDGGPVAVGRSRCEACGRVLRSRDLVPILSWLAARGRARCCGAPLRPALLEAEIGSLALTAALLAPAPTATAPVTVAAGWALWGWALLAATHLLVATHCELRDIKPSQRRHKPIPMKARIA